MEIVVSPDAQAKFDKLPLAIKARVAGIYERLAAWPRVSGAKPLQYKLKGHFRVRTGDWRVIFVVQGAFVRIVDIDHRRDVYKD